MKPYAIRLWFWVFTGLTAGTVLNALYLQPPGQRIASHIETGFHTSAVKKASVRPRRTIPAPQPKPKESRNLPSQKTVQAIQKNLSRLGYQPGPVDGTPGILTRASIMAFEYDNRLSVTGMPRETVLKRILAAKPIKQPRKNLKLAYETNAREVVLWVQQRLAEWGYSPGELDGLMGEATYTAIRRFEKDRFLQPTGRISGRLVQEIRRLSGKTAGL